MTYDDFKISLDKEVLAGALVCASTEKTRYYLCGVCITADLSEDSVTYDAADGLVMFSAKRSGVNSEGKTEKPFQLIIHADIVKTALKMAGKGAKSLTLVAKGGELRLDDVGFEPINGIFPRVDRVIKSAASYSGEGEPAQFDPNLLMRCAKALNPGFTAKKPGSFWIGYRGDNPAYCLGALEEALCVIMPSSAKGLPDETRAPHWTTEPRLPVDD